ncbi:hypothetical protein EKJ_26310 [Qipengyuania flava]|uniref:AbiV family abortive infection protein n=1 Tax=Qipengyuania flava TaxID=192812 RepID=A0A3T1CL90_9SPHN|nr:AbiV family abortive infection protein [Qipengyuania flava]BBI21784.1 hypothetical protein EKJ_26310 [Qipengyuania flava]
MARQLTQYRGPLTAEQAAEGISLARKNASRLIADAELLLEADRHASASALAILAIEELGKVQIIKTLVLRADGADLKQGWKEYRSHRAKNVMWILPKLAAHGARTLMQLREATEIDGDNTAMLNAVKQLCFYTDCFNENLRWSDPSDAVDPSFAPAIIGTAKMLNRERVTTQKELKLWMEIVKPHYEKPTMAGDLIEFQREAFREGLTTTSPESLEAFVRNEPVSVQDRQDEDNQT